MSRLITMFAVGLWALAPHPALADQAKLPAMKDERLPIAAFADRPVFTGPVISPDGKRIAGRATIGDESQIVVTDVDATSISRISLKGMSLATIAWAGSDRLIVTVRTHVVIFGITLPRFNLFAVDVSAGKNRLLDRDSKGLFGGEVLYTHADGSWALVASQDSIFASPSVKRVDLATGDATLVEKARPDVWDWYADESGIVRAGIAYSGKKWTIWYRDVAGEPLRPIKGRQQKDDEGAVDGVRFITGSDTGIIITNAKTGRFAVYALDLKTGAVGTPIFEHPEVDISGVVADPRTGKVRGVTYTAERYHVAWLDDVDKQLQARIDKALPDRENVIQGRSDDGNRILLWSGSASDPGSYYVLDRASRKMITLVALYEALPPDKLRKVEPVSYTARDGLKINGYLTLPASTGAKGLPLIVLPHGGPFLRDTWDFDPYVQFLASRGYAVLQPNFRGSTGYGKDFVERGHGQWGRGMQDDLDDGVDWLVQRGTVDPKRVCIMGGSYGGYAALWGAIRNPERYRCAISYAGVTDLDDMLAYDKKAMSATRYYREWQKKVTGETKRDLDLVSPLQQSARLTVPTLIAHGEKDDNVPVRQARRMVDALDKRGFAVDRVFYADEGHSFTKPETIVNFLERLEAFLKKHNPA